MNVNLFWHDIKFNSFFHETKRLLLKKKCCCSQHTVDAIGVISRMNFTKLTSFNIVLFTVIDDVKTVKDKMLEEGATCAQTGHFYVQNKPMRDSEGKTK